LSSLRRFGNAVVTHPKTVIVILLAFTAMMGYFASQVEFSSSEEDFQPEDEVGLANRRVQEAFGAQEVSVNVLFLADENAIDREPLLAQLELRESISESEITKEGLASTAENPSGMSSPADLISQAGFITELLDQTSGTFSGGNGSSFGPPPGVFGQIMARSGNLSIDEKRTILEGGSLDVQFEGFPMPFEVVFQAYQPSMLPRYLENTPYKGVLPFLLSKDYEGSSARDAIFNVILKGDMDADATLAVEEAIQSMAEDIDASRDSLDVRVLGNQLTSRAISESSGATTGILMTIALTLVVVTLVIVYRSFTDTILNILTLIFAVIWVFGLSVILGYSFNPAITAVPVLIIGLGIDYGIHLTNRYREELRRGKRVIEAWTVSESSVGFAILLTTITTLLGFMSNITSSVASVRHFGILSAAGVVSAFILMITFLPAAKAILDGRKERAGKQVIGEKKDEDRGWGFAKDKVEATRPEMLDEMVCASGPACINKGLGTGAIVARHPVIVLLLVGVITTVALFGAVQLEPRFDFRDFLPKGLEVSKTFDRFFNDFNFSGESVFILVEGGITDPEVLRALSKVENDARESPYFSPTSSIESPLELARSLSDPGSYQYDVDFADFWSDRIDQDGDGMPDSDLVAEDISALYQRLVQSDESQARRVLHRSDSDFASLLVRIPVKSTSGKEVLDLADDMESAAGPLEELEGTVDKATVTGSPIISAITLESIDTDFVRSVVITFAISLLILTVLYIRVRRSFFLGAVALLPLIFVITWGAGTMYFVGIPLNVVTVTILAITVGLGIDYGIHVTERFLEELDRLGDADCSICVAVNHTGSSLFGSATTTVIGFGILSLSIIPPLAQFGVITAITVTFAFLAAVFVLPTFLRLWFILGPGRKRKG